MTLPSGHERLLRYSVERRHLIARTSKRALTISYVIGAIVLVGAAVTASTVSDNFLIVMMIAFAAAIGAQMLVPVVLTKFMPQPGLECPSCGTRVGLAQPAKLFRPVQLTRACPACGQSLE